MFRIRISFHADPDADPDPGSQKYPYGSGSGSKEVNTKLESLHKIFLTKSFRMTEKNH